MEEKRTRRRDGSHRARTNLYPGGEPTPLQKEPMRIGKLHAGLAQAPPRQVVRGLAAPRIRDGLAQAPPRQVVRGLAAPRIRDGLAQAPPRPVVRGLRA